jgi:hypothetical protein
MDVHALRALILEKRNVKISDDDPLFLVLLILEVVLADALQQQTAAVNPILGEIKKQREGFMSSAKETMTIIEACAQREVDSLKQSIREAVFTALENASSIADDRYGDLIRGLDDAVSRAETQIGELVSNLHDAVTRAESRERRLRVLTDQDIDWLSQKRGIAAAKVASRSSGGWGWVRLLYARVRQIFR